MFCSNCGTLNQDEVKFCKSCGKPLNKPIYEDTLTLPNGSDLPAGDETKENIDSIKEEKKMVNSKIILAICGLLIVVGIALFIIANMRITIPFDKYVIVCSDGYDGYGTANVSIDWTAINEKYGKRLRFSKSINESPNITPLESLQSLVKIRLDKDSMLSNGDVINYIWIIDENLSDYIMCRPDCTNGSYIVENLSEVGIFDAFEGLEVSFSGLAPNGVIDIRYSGLLKKKDFVVNKTEGYKNGESVRISLANDDLSYYVNSFGKIPEKKSKDYVVEGLDEYSENFASLPEEFVRTLKEEAKDTIYSYVAKKYDSRNSLSDLEYAGYAFEYAKNTSGLSKGYNVLNIIYTGLITNSEGDFDAMKVYYPVKFVDIVVAEGDISYESNEGIRGNSKIGNTNYNTYGYTNPLVAYKDICDADRNVYGIECGDGFEVFSSYEPIQSLEDINEAFVEMVHQKARDSVASYMVQHYEKSITHKKWSASEPIYVGDYLLVAKNQGTDYEKNNIYIVVYSANVSPAKGVSETVYYPVQYTGIVNLPNGETMIHKTNGIQGHSKINGNSFYTTDGYTDAKNMFDELITANRDRYSYDMSDGLSEFIE